MPANINASDLTAEQRKKLGIRTRTTRFDKEKVRQRAFDLMATLTDLSQADRARIIKQALRLNDL